MTRSLTLRLALMSFAAMLCVILAITAGVIYVLLNASVTPARTLLRLLPFQLFAIVLAAGFSWFIAQRVSTPLRDLAKKALSERAAADEHMRTFISDAGHELKTPLTIIMGYIDALTEGLVIRAEDRQHILGKTLAECRRMRATVGKLISLARLEQEELNIGTVDVAAVARDIGESMRALAPQLTIETPANDEAIAVGNLDEIREAIAIVVDNAIKYGNGCPIDISVSRNADVVAIEIVDSGPGMSAQEQQRAFDPFYRGSAAASVAGTGLGLAVAKRAVERANGSITLNSDVGVGTAVTLYLRGFMGQNG